MTTTISSRSRRRAPLHQPHLPAQAGFSLVELMIAIVLLLVGVVAVAQLVPTAIQSNLRSRYDSSGLILAERQLELISRQPIDAGLPAPGGQYFFCVSPTDLGIPLSLLSPCPDGITLGTVFVYRVGLRPAVSTTLITTVGANLLPNSTSIDWTQAGTAGALVGYRNTFVLNEGTGGGVFYETRWTVVTYFTNFNGTVRPVGKRIIVSVRGGPPGTVQRPATVATLISWRL